LHCVIANVIRTMVTIFSVDTEFDHGYP
jgi:hypothetical protein